MKDVTISDSSRSDTASKKAKSDQPTRRGLRLLAFLIAAAPISLLATARNLEPSDKGLGTHQQLGLPPCSMRVMLGLRCPGCGMTTSWAHFTRGQWTQSLRANTGGFMLAWLGLVGAWLAIGTAWSGELPSLRVQRWFTYVLLGIVVVTLIDWLGRLWG